MKKLLMVSILALSATSFAAGSFVIDKENAQEINKARFASAEKGENRQKVYDLLALGEKCENKLNAGHDLNEKDAMFQLDENCKENSNLIIAAKIVASKSGFDRASESEIEIAFNAALSKIQSLSVQINK